MKKDKILLLSIIILLLISVVVVFFYNTNSDDDVSDSVLVVEEFSNYAWEPIFEGKAITTDGKIYSWHLTGDKSIKTDYNLETENDIYEFVKNNGSLYKCFVSAEKLSNIKRYIKKLDENAKYNEKCHGADMGSKKVYIFKNDKKVLLQNTGDCDGYLEDIYAKKIIKAFNSSC